MLSASAVLEGPKMKGRDKREMPSGRYVTLREYMLASPAWERLDPNSRCLYVEMARRYRGPNSNNGKIPYSVREAARALHIGHSTACRCFHLLEETGFIKVGRRSGFNMKGRIATEWLLTEFPDDTKTGVLASKDFMKWTRERSFNSPMSGPYSATSEPIRVL